MALIFAGTSVADFTVSGTATGVTTAGEKSDAVSEAVRMNGSSSNAIFVPLGAALPDDVWVTFFHSASFGNDALSFFSLQDASGNEIMRLRQITSSSGLTGDRWNGSALAAFGNIARANGRNRFDIHFKRSTTEGKIDVYMDSVLIMSFSGNTDFRAVPAAKIKLGPVGVNGDNYSTFSGVIVASHDTRNETLIQLLPTGAGTETGWVGDYSAIDETGITDTDYIEANTVGQTETWVTADIPVGFASYEVVGVAVSARASAGESPAKIKGVTKVGSTVYEGEPVPPTTYSLNPQQTLFAINPATGVKWTITDVNNAEFGVKATN